MTAPIQHACADRDARIVAAFRAGRSSRQIGADHGLTCSRINHIVRCAADGMEDADRRALYAANSARVAASRACPEKAARNVRIGAEFLAGVAVSALAAQFGLSTGRITSILNCLGLRGAERQITRDPLYVDRALKVAADLAGSNVPQLVSRWRRPRELVWARFAVMASLHKRGVSSPKIGHRLGGRDHSTVLHGIKRAAELVVREPEFAAMLVEVDAA